MTKKLEVAAEKIVAKVEEIAGTAVAKVEQVADKRAEALSAWFDEHIRDSAVSRSTDSYNRIHAALETIRAVLAGHKGD